MRGRGSGAAALAAGVRLRLAFGLGFVLALGVWPAQGAQAQTRYLSKVYVKGEMLEARIAALKPKGLVVTTEYGEGQLTIPWADVERIESQRTLVLAFGDEGEIIEGRLLGVDGDAILFGDDDASARRIPR